MLLALISVILMIVLFDPQQDARKSLQPFVKIIQFTTALTNIITTAIDITAGTRRLIRLSQKFFKSIVPSSSTSEISMPVIKYPDKTIKSTNEDEELWGKREDTSKSLMA